MGSEETTLYRLDLYNKTRYSRRKHKEGLLELASREAYAQRKTHYATVLHDDDRPYCSIATNAGFWGVNFLRDNLDNYLIYDYRDSYSADGRLFLVGIGLVMGNPADFETIYTCQFCFELDRTWSVIIHKGGVGSWDSSLEKSDTPLTEEEFSLLWVDYPAFKEYAELIRLDRIPLAVREWIYWVTDKEFPAFRAHLQRDIDQYQSKV